MLNYFFGIYLIFYIFCYSITNGSIYGEKQNNNRIIKKVDMHTMKDSNYIKLQNYSSSRELIKWLNKASKKGKKRKLIIPVKVCFDDKYKLAIEKAYIVPKKNYREKITLKLEDGAMGIPLLSRLQDWCPEDSTECTVWLEGVWGNLLGNMNETLDNNLFKIDSKNWTFSVYRLREDFHDEHWEIYIEKP
jgi:hypothetical protein